MRGEMKEKHPCESEWYAKALRHLLVQYKESLSLVIYKFLHKLHNSPSYHKGEAAFTFSPKRYAQSLKVWGFGSHIICWQSKRLDRKSLPVWFRTSFSVFVCAGCVCVACRGCSLVLPVIHCTRGMTTDQPKAPAMMWEGVKSCTFMLLLKHG